MVTVVVDIEESRARARAAGAARAAAARARAGAAAHPLGAWDVATEKRPLAALDGRRDPLARALALWRSRRRHGLIPRLADLAARDLAAPDVTWRTIAVEGRPPFARFAEEGPVPAPADGPPVETPWLARDLLACALTRVPIHQRLVPVAPDAGRPVMEQLILPVSADGRRIVRLLVCTLPATAAESAASAAPRGGRSRSFG